MAKNLKLIFSAIQVFVLAGTNTLAFSTPHEEPDMVWSGFNDAHMAVDRYGILRGAWFPLNGEGYEIRWDGGYSDAVIEHKYVGFGDSLTWGFTADYWGSRGGYGPCLQERLRTFDMGAVVILRGFGGERTCSGVERIDSVLEEEDPEYILILEGTNDIQANIARSAIGYNLALMVRKAQEYGSIPVLGTLPPRRDCYYMSDWSEDLNKDYIRPFCQENKVLLADHWKFFNETDDWTEYIDENGQHPNSAGYDLMAECWFVALEEDSPPTGLAAAFVLQTVLLRWNANNDEIGFAGYNVYRKLASWDSYEKLNDEPVAETVYEDTEISPQYYVYAVTAVDKCGNESNYSTEAILDLSSGDGGCFIATAAYGTPMCEAVRVLCRFRDEFLLTSNSGRVLVNLYYRLSPPSARFISGKNFIRAIIRAQLKPVIPLVKILLKCRNSQHHQNQSGNLS